MREQLVDLVGRQRRRGLVHDDHARTRATARARSRPGASGPRDRLRSGAVDVEVASRRAQDLGRAAAHAATSRPRRMRWRMRCPAKMFSATESSSNITGLLVDGGDAVAPGVLRAVKLDRLAADHDPSGVRTVDPGQDLDGGRLAGAVLAEQRHHLGRRVARSSTPSSAVHAVEAASRCPRGRGRQARPRRGSTCAGSGATAVSRRTWRTSRRWPCRT